MFNSKQLCVKKIGPDFKHINLNVFDVENVGVNIIGAPKALVPEDVDKIHGEADGPTLITSNEVQIALMKSQQKRLLEDTMSCEWSNESLASELSARNSIDFLDTVEIGSSRYGYSASEGGDLSVPGDDLESGCGEAPCEIDQEAAFQVRK